MENQNLKRAKKLARINTALIGTSLFFQLLVNPFIPNFYVADIFVGLPILLIFVVAPLGLIFSIKSIKKKEGNARIRFRYLYTNLFYVLILVLLTTIIIQDVIRIY